MERRIPARVRAGRLSIGADKGQAKINIGLVTSNFWPEQTGIGQVISEFALFLQQNGFQVSVATSMPYYPDWRIHKTYKRKILLTENVRGMHVTRGWHYVRPAPSAFGRVLHEFTLCITLLPVLIRLAKRCDIAIIVMPDLFLAGMAIAVARTARVKSILFVQDVMPDAAIETGVLKNPSLIRMSTALARKVYNLAGQIYTIGPGMLRRVATYVAPSKPIRIVSNTVDIAEFSDTAKRRAQFRSRVVHLGKFTVVHSGNMGKKQNLPIIAEVASLMSDYREIGFLVFGDGGEKESFLTLIAEREIQNVFHFPLQSREQFGDSLIGADVVLITQLAEVSDIVVPSKLITAMAAGAMIIAACSNDTEMARILRESDAGIVISPNDARGIVEAILKVKRGVIDSEGYRRRAKNYAADNYSRDRVYGPVVTALRSLVHQDGL